MDSKIDAVREALIKLRSYAKSFGCDYQEECTLGEDDMCQSCEHVYIAELALAALSAIDPEAIRRALRSASNIVKETALEMGLDDEEVYSISGIIDPDIPGNYEAIIDGHICLSAETAHDNLGTESNPFKGTYNAVVFQRHDNGLNFGVCERDDGFEFVVHGTNRESSHYALHRNAIMERLDEPAQDDGKPEVGDIVAWDKEGLNVEAYKHPRREIVRRPVVLMRFAEVKRRLEEAEK